MLVSMIEPGGHKTGIFSAEGFSTTMHCLWNGLSPELKNDYGEQYRDRGNYSPLPSVPPVLFARPNPRAAKTQNMPLFSKSCVFRCPHVTRKTEFSNIPTLRAFLKRVFKKLGFHRIRVDGSQTEKETFCVF